MYVNATNPVIALNSFKHFVLSKQITLAKEKATKMSEVNNKFEVNEDLARERKLCNFNLQEVTFIVDGGEKNTIARRKIGKIKVTACLHL